MLNYRIMRHVCGCGSTTIVLDRIGSMKEAAEVANMYRQKLPCSHFYIQEYEEARHLPDVDAPKIVHRLGLWYCYSYRGTASGPTKHAARKNWEQNIMEVNRG